MHRDLALIAVFFWGNWDSTENQTTNKLVYIPDTHHRKLGKLYSTVTPCYKVLYETINICSLSLWPCYNPVSLCNKVAIWDPNNVKKMFVVAANLL